MEDNIIIEEVEFSQELYEKNIKENSFNQYGDEGLGGDTNANN